MPRCPRICPAGVCFHVLNRAVARLGLFEKREDYEATDPGLQAIRDVVNAYSRVRLDFNGVVQYSHLAEPGISRLDRVPANATNALTTLLTKGYWIARHFSFVKSP